MRLRTVIAIGLVPFVLSSLIFLEIGSRKEQSSRDGFEGPPLYISQKERNVIAIEERSEQRPFRIFAQAGCPLMQPLTITPEEVVEIPGITIPNIRVVLRIQSRVLTGRNKVRSGKLIEALLKEAEENGRCHEWAASTRHPRSTVRVLYLRPESFSYFVEGGPFKLMQDRNERVSSLSIAGYRAIPDGY